MAVCKYCGKDMNFAAGCVRVPIPVMGRLYEPIRVGDDRDPLFGADPDMKCLDCGAEMGEYHHPGCDQERCPVCGGQASSCHCGEESKNSDVDKFALKYAAIIRRCGGDKTGATVTASDRAEAWKLLTDSIDMRYVQSVELVEIISPDFELGREEDDEK